MRRVNRKPRGVVEMLYIEILLALILCAIISLCVRIICRSGDTYNKLAADLHCASVGSSHDPIIDCGDKRYVIVPNQFHPKLMEEQ